MAFLQLPEQLAGVLTPASWFNQLRANEEALNRNNPEITVTATPGELCYIDENGRVAGITLSEGCLIIGVEDAPPRVFNAVAGRKYLRCVNKQIAWGDPAEAPVIDEVTDEIIRLI